MKKSNLINTMKEAITSTLLPSNSLACANPFSMQVSHAPVMSKSSIGACGDKVSMAACGDKISFAGCGEKSSEAACGDKG